MAALLRVGDWEERIVRPEIIVLEGGVGGVGVVGLGVGWFDIVVVGMDGEFGWDATIFE